MLWAGLCPAVLSHLWTLLVSRPFLRKSPKTPAKGEQKIPGFIPVHLFLSGLGRGVQEVKERWSHSAQEGEVLRCLCVRFPSFSTRSRCRSGEVRGWEFSLPENPSTTSVSSYFFFFFLIFTSLYFPTVGKRLFGSEDAESSSSGRGRPGRASVFNFNCLGEDKTAARVCVRARACWGPLNRLHLLWGPVAFREAAFLHNPPDGSVTTSPACRGAASPGSGAAPACGVNAGAGWHS